MFRHVMFVCSLAGGLLVSTAYAQQDYFTADKCGNCYLTIMEGAHVRTIPDWIKKGRLDNAMGDVRYSLDRFPNHPVALQQLSMLAQLTKQTVVAVGYFERAITLFPQYALTRSQYGVFLLSIDRVDAGLASLKEAIAIEPTLSVGYAGLAHAYFKKGNIDEARAAAGKARELGFAGRLPEGLE
jgi:predicted Zn-dependent protease